MGQQHSNKYVGQSSKDAKSPVQRPLKLLEVDEIKICFSHPEGVEFIRTQAMNYKGRSLNRHSILDLRTNERLLELLRPVVPSSTVDEIQTSEPVATLERKEEEEEKTSDPFQPFHCLLQQAKEKQFEKVRNQSFESIEEDRAFACMLGLMVGDALGSPLEFTWVEYPKVVDEENSTIRKAWKQDDEFFTMKEGLDQDEVWTRGNPYNKFMLKPGQYTDDSSMALCVMDCLIVKLLTDRALSVNLDGTIVKPEQDFDFELNGRLLRLMFLNWWYFGYNNSLGLDDTNPGGGCSCGLGGNVKSSLMEFLRKPELEVTEAGDRTVSGNGSVMRLAPIPIVCAKSVDWEISEDGKRELKNLDKAMNMAHKHSKTTHQGDEAAELCSLLAFIIVNAINRADGKKDVIEDLSSFNSKLYSVRCLADSKQEEKHTDNAHLKLEDRNWNWKDPNFKFCATRATQQPGYVGSYAMDAVAMALHCVYTTDNFTDAVLKSANMRGDSDSFTAVTASLAGAIYGASSIPKSWLAVLQKWDRNGDIALKAYKLYHKSFNLE